MALSSADKQRSYRERQRNYLKQLETGNVTENSVHLQAKTIVDSFGIDQMDIDSRSYFVGFLIGRLCSELKKEYVIAGLFDSIGNVTVNLDASEPLEETPVRFDSIGNVTGNLDV